MATKLNTEQLRQLDKAHSKDELSIVRTGDAWHWQ